MLRAWSRILIVILSLRDVDANASAVDLIIVRHGQSEGNVFPWQGPLSGQDPPLTAVGREQSETTAQCLADAQPAPGHGCSRPDFVFSSRLLRAMETALLAFPHKEVHVAPHVCEREKGPMLFHPGSVPKSESQQLAQAREDLGDGPVGELSFAWLPRPRTEGYRPPDWDRFLAWLWGRPEVQLLLAEKGAVNERPCIALVSHGNFLEALLRARGWRGGHPRNAAAVAARLGIEVDGGSATGFGALAITSVLCGGGSAGSARAIWICVAVLTLLSVALGVAYACRRRGRRSASHGRELESPYVSLASLKGAREPRAAGVTTVGGAQPHAEPTRARDT